MNFLNCSCNNPCIFIKDSEKNIIKFQKSYELLKWESNIYISFVNLNIFPLIDINFKKHQIKYFTKNLISMREFFEKYKNISKINLFLNELFCFINICKNNNFLHGNLQIDNVYINEKNFTKIYVIDYTNSYNLNENENEFIRSSYLKEFDSKNNEQFLCFWDFFTIYISIKNYFYNNKNLLYLLDKNIKNYISFTILYNMISKYSAN